MSEGGITRRVVLRNGTVATLAVILARPGSGLADAAVPFSYGRPIFLTEDELETLRGLVDSFIPGKALDNFHGARTARIAEAIDMLLGAFEFKRPRIYAGAPFSDRGGAPVNHFRKFLRLDRYEELAWKLRIKGSRGKKRLEFNGPVTGWQQTYREGLAALGAAAAPSSFNDLHPLLREPILGSGDSRIDALVEVAWPHTWQFMYGAPEYGGNQQLIGWEYTAYDGDVHPRGYTRTQIEKLDRDAARRGSTSSLLPEGVSLDEVVKLGARGIRG